MKIFIECKALKVPMGVVKAHIDEGINQITVIDLELASRSALEPSDLEEAVGKPIKLVAEDTIDNTLHKVRWDGFVFEMIDVLNGKDDNDVFYYTMAVRPRLWLLNYYVQSRSYPDKSRIQVIDELLKEHGFSEDLHYTKSYFKEDAFPVFNQLLEVGQTESASLGACSSMRASTTTSPAMTPGRTRRCCTSWTTR